MKKILETEVAIASLYKDIVFLFFKEDSNDYPYSDNGEYEVLFIRNNFSLFKKSSQPFLSKLLNVLRKDFPEYFIWKKSKDNFIDAKGEYLFEINSTSIKYLKDTRDLQFVHNIFSKSLMVTVSINFIFQNKNSNYELAEGIITKEVYKMILKNNPELLIWNF